VESRTIYSKAKGATVMLFQTIAASSRPQLPIQAQARSGSRRSVLLDFFSGMFDIFTGTMSSATSYRAEHEGHRCKQQQNYSFNHNRSVLWFIV
jgi:hypothetical protein